jgi:carbon-monoxide dehydrogenase medium subunit
MIPAAFDYERAESVEEALELLGSREDAKVLAGGHSLLPLMKLRLARPALLVDIDRLAELEYVREDGDDVEIGALSRIGVLSRDPTLWKHAPLLAHVCGEVGDPQVRHRATIGGSVAHGDPASDPPTALLTLDAHLVVRSPSGQRTVPASDFFEGIFETDLGPQDVLTAIRVPKQAPATGWSYQKFHRRAIDWAMVAVAALVQRDDGHVTRAAVGLTNMGATPLRAAGVERAMAGADAGGVASAAEHAAEGTNPVTDTNASSEFRMELCRVLTRRALEEALSR